MTLASVGEFLGYGVVIFFLIAVPAISFVLSIVAMQRRGLNWKVGLASCVCAGTFLVGIILLVQTLRREANMGDDVKFWAWIVVASLHVLSALLVLWGLAETRRRHRWPRGRKRAAGVFVLNVLALAGIAALFYIHTHPEIAKKLGG